MLRIQADDELVRALASLERAQQGTQEAMREAADEKIDATWKQQLNVAAGTELERRIMVDGADSTVDNLSFTLWAGIGDPVSGGLGSGPRDWPGVEFGMVPYDSYDTKRRKTIRIAGSGTVMKVATKITIGKNLRTRNPDGYVAFPTIRKHVPTFVAAWVHGLISQFDDVNGTALDIEGN